MRHEKYHSMEAAGASLDEILEQHEQDLVLFLATIDDEFEDEDAPRP